MQPQLATFKRFPDAIQAKELEQLLKDKNIPCEYLEVSSGLDSSFSGQFSKEHVIKVFPDDFEKATQIVEELAAQWANDVPADYYLFSFTNEELQDLVRKKFEWSEFDYQLAKKLLAERGVVVDEAAMEKEYKQQVSEIAAPEKLDDSWVVMGYVASVLGGISIFRTVVILTSKKDLPDGRTVYSYKESDRVHARLMLVISVIVWILLLCVYLLR